MNPFAELLGLIGGLLLMVVLSMLFLASALRVLKEYERGVIFRLGRVIPAKGPRLILLIPVIDRMVKVTLHLVAIEVPSQDITTRDNVSIKVNVVVYFKVVDSVKAVVQVEDYLHTTSQLAQTTLRSVCGQMELDELLAKRDKINAQLQKILDTHTDPWGVKVASVDVKYIDLLQEMPLAMAKQAEAERERRAKIINFKGEFQAAQKPAPRPRISSPCVPRPCNCATCRPCARWPLRITPSPSSPCPWPC
ncbi:hypothetical protein DFAR_3200018 [Desulfarculales bacterium]